MSTDHHNAGTSDIRLPVHADVSYEPTDVQTKPILRFLMILAIVVICSYGITWVFYRGTLYFWAHNYGAPTSMMSPTTPLLPPEPRLQGMPGHENDGQLDWREKLKEDTAANNKLEWIDQKDGIAQIPVRDAMKILAEKGLPAIAIPATEKKQAK